MDVLKVTNTGLGIITSRLKGAGTEPSYCGSGTGVTAASITDTVLQTPRAEARVLGTTTQQQTVTTGDTYQVVATITYASTAGAITEVGLFDASTAGNMFLHGTFSAINVNPADSIQFTIKTQFVSA